MTDQDFKEALEAFAESALQHRAQGLIAWTGGVDLADTQALGESGTDLPRREAATARSC
jgi:hypothetical protein